MTGGSNIRAIGPEGASNAQGDTSAEVPDTLSAHSLEGTSEEMEEYWDDADAPARNMRAKSIVRRSWPVLAALLIVGWTGFFAFMHYPAMTAGGTMDQWTGWVTAWAVPVLLVISAWLLIMRNSSREAERFGTIARSLSAEAANLEDRLITVNRELSLAREFLASQSRELDTLGRVATDRLSVHADELQALISTNGEQVDAIATVSTTALENMGKLRDDLPVIANSAKDVSNHIGTAGMTAHSHIAELVGGFERLNEFGRASGNQVDTIRSEIDTTLDGFEARMLELDEGAAARFAALQDRSERFRTDIDSREVETLAAMRRRADALSNEVAAIRGVFETTEDEALATLRNHVAAIREETDTVGTSLRASEEVAVRLWGDRVETLKAQLVTAIDEIRRVDEDALASANAKLDSLRLEAEAVDSNIAERNARLHEQIAGRRANLAEEEDAALALLTARLADFDADLTARRSGQLAQADALAQQTDAVGSRIEALSAALEHAGALSEETQANIARHAEDIDAKLGVSRATLSDTDIAVRDLTDACVRLLELVQASASHSQNELPSALQEAEARLILAKEEAGSLDGIVAQALGKAEDLSAHVRTAQSDQHLLLSNIDNAQGKIAAFHGEATEGARQLKTELAGLAEHSDVMARDAQNRLEEAITALQSTARDTPALVAGELHAKIGAIAADLADQTGARLDHAMKDRAQTSIAGLDEAITQASSKGRDAAIHLRDQLAKIDELAGNLESRVSRAREQAEEQVNNDFARRMALLTESLNSNAIDIAKALSTEVTDTAWASYLKGDRGIFTRRAVRLLDNTEVRDIADIYDGDLEFRENVSRYIHDFEAMLRSMLSTRDGNALGVTILSSDMGKLYVILAQAIERLRD